MMVSDNQLAYIKGYLLNEGVSRLALQDDLTDHFCCVVEEQLEDGIEFEDAFDQARGRITPQGAKEIEEDLNFLLTIKKKIMVRKVVFIFGFIGVLDFLLAAVMGLLPGSTDTELVNLLIMAGILTLMISVVPFWFYQLYKRSINKLQQT
jgi:hypothetical protein